MYRAKTNGAKLWRWSITRSRALHSCPRAFEFARQSSSPSSRAESPMKLASIVGVTVHDAIRREIDRWVGHAPVSSRQAQKYAADQLRRLWFSRPTSIVEVANGLELDPDLYRKLESAVQSQLDRFFRMIWPLFAQARYEQHEVLSLFEFDGLPMSAKADLTAWDDSNRLLVVDWKTGQRAGDLADRAQLAFYTLWARSEFRLELQRIRPLLVKIRTGEVIRFEPQEEDLDFVVALISADFAAVERMDESREFPPSPESRRCWGCMYLHRCNEGKNLTGFASPTLGESRRVNSAGF